MKKFAIFVLGVLVGLAGYAIGKEKIGGSSHTTGGSAGPGISITKLSAVAEKELGIDKGDAFVTVVRFDGDIEYFQPSGSEYSKIELPMKKPVTVQRLQSMDLLTFTASPPCVGGSQAGGSALGIWCPR